MSLAQFNGVVSNSILSVASLGFPDGTSLTSGSIVSSLLIQNPDSFNDVPSGNYLVATFPSVPAGIYFFASAYGITGSPMTNLNFYLEINGFASNLFGFTYRTGTGSSGYTNYQDNFSGVIKLTTTTDVQVYVEVSGGTGSTFNLSSVAGVPMLLARLV